MSVTTTQRVRRGIQLGREKSEAVTPRTEVNGQNRGQISPSGLADATCTHHVASGEWN